MERFRIVQLSVALLARLMLVSSHDNMVFPYVWMDSDKSGVWVGGHGGGIGCGSISGPDGDSVESPLIGCLANWFTNNTRIPQTSKDQSHNPWHAPGTAPVFSPCGMAGGNSEECTGGNQNEKFGDCCGRNCSGYSFGNNAEEYGLMHQLQSTGQLVHYSKPSRGLHIPNL